MNSWLVYEWNPIHRSSWPLTFRYLLPATTTAATTSTTAASLPPSSLLRSLHGSCFVPRGGGRRWENQGVWIRTHDRCPNNNATNQRDKLNGSSSSSTPRALHEHTDTHSSLPFHSRFAPLFEREIERERARRRRRTRDTCTLTHSRICYWGLRTE
jgi:hypothetical protein